MIFLWGNFKAFVINSTFWEEPSFLPGVIFSRCDGFGAYISREPLGPEAAQVRRVQVAGPAPSQVMLIKKVWKRFHGVCPPDEKSWDVNEWSGTRSAEPAVVLQVRTGTRTLFSVSLWLFSDQ